MTTALLDTNTILRYLSNDIPEQAEKIENRLQDAQDGKINLIIPAFIVIEVIFHLDRWYKFNRKQITKTLTRFFTETNTYTESLPTILDALKQYPKTTIDLLLWSSAKNSKQKVLSFDKDFDKLVPKLRLKP